ncbi:hypothetical protein OUZ56_020530 [Daphnia magna]|uniref:Uncharacterized protein n=1 Tax=Daphnia magna TaxID=35525 RepID=A0ABQ9ZEQ5_9CRUS|nr:hypothetical protein OUZ56_020530 [Daphnia magna]
MESTSPGELNKWKLFSADLINDLMNKVCDNKERGQVSHVLLVILYEISSCLQLQQLFVGYLL